jgi:hypothetical protein
MKEIGAFFIDLINEYLALYEYYQRLPRKKRITFLVQFYALGLVIILGCFLIAGVIQIFTLLLLVNRIPFFLLLLIVFVIYLICAPLCLFLLLKFQHPERFATLFKRPKKK